MEFKEIVATTTAESLAADTLQESVANVIEGMVVHLYRRNKLLLPDLNYFLRYDEPLVLMGSVLYMPHESGQKPLRRYSRYNASSDLLIPANATPELTEAIQKHHEVAAKAQADSELEAVVRAHPLYTKMRATYESECEKAECLEQKVLDAEKLWGVDAILTSFDECYTCFGSGLHYFEPCFVCRGTGVQYYVWFRKPGQTNEEVDLLTAGIDARNRRKVVAEAMEECRKMGWKHVMLDGKRRTVISRRAA
jgi:hypothetical protein